jgi:predicted nucleotidyltransferase
MKYKPGEISSVDDLSLPPWERGVRQGGMMSKAVAYKNLRDFIHVMNIHDIRYVLIFGTLLGVIRQNDFIDHDSDVDVLCFREDYRKIGTAIRDLELFGFTVPIDGLPMLDHYCIRGGEKIDINWVLDNGHGELLYDYWIKWDKKFFKFPLPTVPFGPDITAAIPHYATELLAITYGSNWRVPSRSKGFMG